MPTTAPELYFLDAKAIEKLEELKAEGLALQKKHDISAFNWEMGRVFHDAAALGKPGHRTQAETIVRMLADALEIPFETARGYRTVYSAWHTGDRSPVERASWTVHQVLQGEQYRNLVQPGMTKRQALAVKRSRPEGDESNAAFGKLFASNRPEEKPLPDVLEALGSGVEKAVKSVHKRIEPIHNRGGVDLRVDAAAALLSDADKLVVEAAFAMENGADELTEEQQGQIEAALAKLDSHIEGMRSHNYGATNVEGLAAA